MRALVKRTASSRCTLRDVSRSSAWRRRLKRILLLVERTLVPGLDPYAQLLAEPAHRALREGGGAELFGDLRHLARRDALSRSHEIYVHHLHHRQDERLLAAQKFLRLLVAPEQISRERPVSRLWHV